MPRNMFFRDGEFQVYDMNGRRLRPRYEDAILRAWRNDDPTENERVVYAAWEASITGISPAPQRDEPLSDGERLQLTKWLQRWDILAPREYDRLAGQPLAFWENLRRLG